ncbi:MAG: mevalonate kinase [Chloroflexi bacterium]|nr:mevalonate kinase [Chloroflexota bacterium]
MPAISASAPGKTILFGEHAVVYGFPAIAVPLPDISLTVIVQALPNQNSIHIVNTDLKEDFLIEEIEKQNPYNSALEVIRKFLKIDHLPAMRITLSSNIPLASGLGSSAAFAVAISKSVTSFLGFRLSLEDLNCIAYEIEKRQHGTPSGIDNTVICYQKPVFFLKDQPVEFINPSKPMTLILANSGIQSLTREAVEQVREKRDRERDLVDDIFYRIGSIANNARPLIEDGDLESIGKLMLENHQLLKELELSLDILDDLVEASMKTGAYGAKLCGSGNGGNVVALVPPEKSDMIKEVLIKKGAYSCLVSTVAPSKGGM